LVLLAACLMMLLNRAPRANIYQIYTKSELQTVYVE
jgi:hypothetical protein